MLSCFCFVLFFVYFFVCLFVCYIFFSGRVEGEEKGGGFES